MVAVAGITGQLDHRALTYLLCTIRVECKSFVIELLFTVFMPSRQDMGHFSKRFACRYKMVAVGWCQGSLRIETVGEQHIKAVYSL